VRPVTFKVSHLRDAWTCGLTFYVFIGQKKNKPCVTKDARTCTSFTAMMSLVLSSCIGCSPQNTFVYFLEKTSPGLILIHATVSVPKKGLLGGSKTFTFQFDKVPGSGFPDLVWVRKTNLAGSLNQILEFQWNPSTGKFEPVT